MGFPRSIPAYAGQTMTTLPEKLPKPVYPRVCRANLRRRRGLRRRHGLSPRMQGKRPGPDRQRGPREVYPRVCRANTLDRRDAGHHGGLSPRMQGKRGLFTLGQARNGSIPAYAGQTVWRSVRPASGRVYPRVCRANG